MRLLLILLWMRLWLPAAADVEAGDWWKHWPEGGGLVFEDQESAWLQSLHVGGYAHVQAAHVDGDAGGGGLSYTRRSDWRRVRGVVKGRVLRALDFNIHLNLVQDEGAAGGGVEFDYHSVFLAELAVDLARMIDLGDISSLQLGYGKRKLVELSEEIDTSVNSILSVERSALAGLLVPFRQSTAPTGAWVRMTRGDELVSLGVFTTDSSPEFGGWGGGRVFLASWRHDFSESWGLDEALVSITGGWQDAAAADELYSQWEWVAAPWMRLGQGRWGLRVSGAVGQNDGRLPGAGGAFGGAVVMPSFWLVEGRLQGVLRYAVMASEGEAGLRLPSRYLREAGLAENGGLPLLAAGAGDFHESAYAGLVCTIVPEHFTLLAGLEWERLESRDVRVFQGVTAWFSTRLIF
ncbi:hypothetical protein HZ994_00315 [Akkermansiaceae bacterium]|nr:hypothetical protein HZ994_00315 [Akkermansiaceae bacterium]